MQRGDEGRGMRRRGGGEGEEKGGREGREMTKEHKEPLGMTLDGVLDLQCM